MVTNKNRTSRLGRGLSSLMTSPVKVSPGPVSDEPVSDDTSTPAATPPDSQGASVEVSALDKPNRVAGRGYNPASSVLNPPAGDRQDSGLHFLPIDSLQPNRHQPRQHFDAASLKRLADSIASEGVMQPIIARPSEAGADRYEVVAGERRWRAAQIAGLATLPVIIRDLNDRQMAEWALIENIQREDLNPIERAEAFARLIDQFGLSHEEAGARVGMDRSSITNHLRLLGLAKPVRLLISEGLLSMGQARALAGLSDVAQQQMLAERAVRQGMSVRDVESAVRKLIAGEKISSKSGSKPRASHLVDLEKQIAEQLGTKVAIKPGRKKGAGTLSIEFYSLDQFDTLIGQLGVKTDEL
jgi:ParB family transcriptional regulator, chromosome partitioning protein